MIPGKSERPRKKATALETAKRIEVVLGLRLEGSSFREIVAVAARQGWGINERQIRTYIQRADELIVQEQKGKLRDLIALHLARRELLYARAVKAEDYRTALAILEDDAKLRGLYPDKELKELLKMAKEQSKRIEELQRRLEPGAGPEPDGPTRPRLCQTEEAKAG
jgi:hypothetical protein